jgi:opacity protein-like surface antigen
VKAEKLKSKQNITYKTMKKTFFLIMTLCLFALSVTEAQVNKGRVLLGVSTSFSYVNYGSDLMSLGFTTIKQKSNSSEITESDPEKVTTFNFLPKIGYFVTNNFAIGLDACIASSVEKVDAGEKFTMSSVGLGPFVRYYIPGKKVMPFFEINSEFGTIKTHDEYQTYNSTSKTSMTSIGGGAGIAVKLGDKVTFDIMADYNSMSEKAKENNPNDERTVQGTLGFKFGFVILFGSN